MKKWSFPNNTTTLKNLYVLTKAVAENNITIENHHQELMRALNENGANRNEANHHPIHYITFYKMVTQKEDHYEITPYGRELIERYEELKNIDECSKFLFKVVLDIKYPNDAVETDSTYQIYPFRILFQTLCDERLQKRVTQKEIEKYFSIVKTEDDYEKLVKIILDSRNGIEPVEVIEEIKQVPKIVGGWCNQFHILKRENEYLKLPEIVIHELFPLANNLTPIIAPYIPEFKKFCLTKYLFENLSMGKIEEQAYNEKEKPGFIVKGVLDYYQVHKDAKGFYQNKNIQEIANYLLVQPDPRYRNIAKILREEKTKIEVNKNQTYLEQFKQYYQNHLEEYLEIDSVKNFNTIRENFLNEFPLEKIKELTIEEYVMGPETSKESLTYQLEYGKYKDIGPSIGGNTCAKHGIYRSENGEYCGLGNKEIDNPEEFFDDYKQQLYNFLLDCSGDIKNFETITKYPLLKGTYMLLTKLAYLYYPEKFVNICSSAKLKILLNSFGYSYNPKNTPEQLSNILNENIRKDFELLNEKCPETIGASLYRFVEDIILNEKTEEETSEIVTGADSILYYGVPGCGKSHIVNERYCKNKNYMRIVFHPEYTNGEFVGQIFPTLKTTYKEDGTEEKIIEYSFKQGPFTKILKQAINDRNQTYYLIIEELNRGNAPTIFGDIFQLIDRDEEGNSKYEIDHEDLSREIYGTKDHKIKIPSNLYIIATMNSSDQNVFPLDTAFKRRWTMEKISNKFDMENDDIKEIALKRVPNTNITWKNFVETINKEILNEKYGSNGEDKQLGIFFVRKDILRDDETEDIRVTRKFAHKVLVYLWDDVVKYERQYMFKDCNTEEELIEKYEQIGLGIFQDTITFQNESIENEQSQTE